MTIINFKNPNCILVGFFLLLPFFTGCKISQKILNETDSRIGDMTFPKERNFIRSELIIGRRICDSLKKKRVFFQTLYDRQEQFRFHGTVMDCEGRVTLNSDFDATISTSALEYSSLTPRDNYFRDIITDKSGVINDLCVSISASDNVSNTINSGSLKYTVNFLIAENYDRYDVKKELSDNKGGFTIAGGESVSVFQTGQVDPKFIGVEKERTRLISCGGQKLQSMKQSWKAALTKF